MTRDPCRDALDYAIADATHRIERHRGQIQRAREELRRALADRAVARELLREFDQIDGAGGGKS